MRRTRCTHVLGGSVHDPYPLVPVAGGQRGGVQHVLSSKVGASAKKEIEAIKTNAQQVRQEK